MGIAFTPALAQAATPAQTTGSHLTTTHSASTAAENAAGLKTFSSPAKKSVRVQKAATAQATSATSTGTTIYATTGDFSCSTDTGTGTSANPYCALQDAVNAASPGDTIDVEGSVGYFSESPVTITTSDLTIVGTSTQSWLAHTTGAAITLDGVTNVTIKNMMLASQNSADVAIENSSNITLDSDYLGGYAYGNHDGVTIDGTSDDVTVSRTYVDTGGWSANYAAVRIASGAQNVTLASDLIADSSIIATGVAGLDVTGNTIQRGCASGIDVEGSSTAVYLYNNVLEDTNASFDYAMGGYPSTCSTWSPDITVAAGSTASTVSDYNDFDVTSTDAATAPYSWGGATYSTVASFQSATNQGTHDTNDTTTFGGVYIRDNESANIQAAPSSSSPAANSANLSAPGELTTDFYGDSGYKSRGAIQIATPNPNLGVSLSGGDISAFGVELDTTVSNYTSSTGDLSVTINWGDSQTTTVDNETAPTETHVYSKLGTYTISVTVSDGEGDIATNSITGAETAGSEFTAYGPTRLLDTRIGKGTSSAAPLANKHTLKLQVTGAGTSGNTIPSGITAVVLNVTSTDSTGSGYVSVYGDEDSSGAAESLPSTSNLNFGAGQTVPNLVVVPVGANGVVDFYYSSAKAAATTHLVADVAGYFTTANTSKYVSVTPARILDTRKGIGTGKVAKIPANGSITLSVAGSDGGTIPSSGVTAVAMNLTVVNSTHIGDITAYPADESMPTASNVNYAAGETVANMSVVPLQSSGKVTFHNTSAGPVDLIADVDGYYSSTTTSTKAAAYLPLDSPQRLLDTRTGSVPLYTDFAYYLGLTDVATETAFVFNATVTQTTGNGVLALYPYNPNKPTALPTGSNLNYLKGETVPNLAFASPGTVEDTSLGAYDLGIYLGGNGTAQLILDLFGVFESQ
ncbi:right-handed parallel beta-helix repeat-containing protein [Actinospica sp. MGRD01-02]|uniref:Right-handed parallel beta-helix repeat-containing protein n=1 Tax=Actinospica acidithermotolerans TaxID=2828514 RepID=A0A941E424_9ACTN|nr:right-handed parallel beta-helix repeat-containing protein [Actinospica acidithermotolerans]MBR7824766.1 right-handed parallel beta-helix repeat-containing protein [Actinospica acidithermotolerans]